MAAEGTDCINISGDDEYNCFVKTATWDTPPFRFIQDAHKIMIDDVPGNMDSCSVMGDFPVIIDETWHDITVLAITHGSYECAEAVEVEIPYDQYVAYQSSYGRKRRDEDAEGDESVTEEGERSYLSDNLSAAYNKPTYTYASDDPTHPVSVTVNQVVCTLTCPNAGEIPASGSWTSTCQEFNHVTDSGNDMVVNWVERITACVNPDDILADLLCEGDSCTPSVTEGDPPPESNVVAEVQEEPTVADESQVVDDSEKKGDKKDKEPKKDKEGKKDKKDKEPKKDKEDKKAAKKAKKAGKENKKKDKKAGKEDKDKKKADKKAGKKVKKDKKDKKMKQRAEIEAWKSSF